MKYLNFVLLFIFTTLGPIAAFAASELCEFPFTRNVEGLYTEDLKLLGKINRYDDFISFFRTSGGVKEAPARRMLEGYRKIFKPIQGKFYKGENWLAVGTYNVLFRKVESSALIVEHYQELLKLSKRAYKLSREGRIEIINSVKLSDDTRDLLLVKLETEDSAIAFMKFLKKKIDSNLNTLGLHFENYNLVQIKLNKLKKSTLCTPKCQEALKSFYKEVGVVSSVERNLFPTIVRSNKSLSLKRISRIYWSNPQAVIMGKKRELFHEFVGLFNRIFNNANFIRRFYLSAASSSFGNNWALVRLFKSMFDKRAHFEHMPIIQKIANSELLPAGQVKVLNDSTTKISRNNLLVDFARIEDGAVKKSFNKIKKYATENKMTTLISDIEKAEKLAKKIGSFSDKMMTGAVKTILTLGAAGTAGAYLLYKPSVSSDGSNQGDTMEEIELTAEDLAGLEILKDGSALKGQSIEYNSVEDKELNELILKTSKELILLLKQKKLPESGN